MKTLRAYILGFGLSIALTLVAFWLVGEHLRTEHAFPSHGVAVSVLIVLAVAQLLVQLTLFLHLGEERKPRWNLVALTFALLIVAILVGGTIWIMNNLSHGQMQEPHDIFTEENIFPSTHND